MGTNRKYDAEFKREAIRLVIEEGVGAREVENYDLPREKNWIAQQSF